MTELGVVDMWVLHISGISDAARHTIALPSPDNLCFRQAPPPRPLAARTPPTASRAVPASTAPTMDPQHAPRALQVRAAYIWQSELTSHRYSANTSFLVPLWLCAEAP